MYYLFFYVPLDHSEKVKAAIFAAGAGRFKNYDQCCWQTEGVGQFRPLQGSDPHIGEQESLNKVPEIKIECVCAEGVVDRVIEALLASHPYEEPAYGLVKIEN